MSRAANRPRLVLHKIIFYEEWTPVEIDDFLFRKNGSPVLVRYTLNTVDKKVRTVCMFNIPPPGTVLDAVIHLYKVPQQGQGRVEHVIKKRCEGHVYLDAH
jgi:hypothetical protein